MSKIFDVQNTSGTLVLNLHPGATNGRFSAHRDTDLRLYGEGVVHWGEGLDENFYRLLENFACPAKVTGDTLPEYMGGAGENSDYNVNTHGPAPKSWHDLNDRNLGVNTPITGQLWYNTSSKVFYVYHENRDPKWVSLGGVAVGDTAPQNPQIGDLWFNTVIPQLMVWDGTQWISVAERYLLKSGGTMEGHIVLFDDPTFGLHPVTLQYLEANYATSSQVSQGYVAKAGDTMTGFLTLHALPTLDMHAATKGYVDNAVGNLSNVYTKTESDNRYVNVTGDTMTGPLTLSGDPTANLHAVTKQYVDSIVSAGVGTAVDEFTATSGQTIFSTTNVITAAKTGGKARQQVFVNGVLQREIANYTVTGTNRITFITGLAVGDEVVIYQL